MKLYLGGPMRGYPDFNFPAFDDAAARLRAGGFEVVSPAEHDREGGFDETAGSLDGFDMEAAIRWDLEQVIACDGIALLPGWEKSSGCAVELAMAKFLDKTCYRYEAHGSTKYALRDHIYGDFAYGWDVTGNTPASVEISPPAEPNPGFKVVQEDEAGVDQVFTPPSWMFDYARKEYIRQMTTNWEDMAINRYANPVNAAKAEDDEAHGLISASGEVRVTDPTTGGQKGKKPARFDLLPQGPLWEVAELYGKGAEKYADRNWEKGYAWSLSFAALSRHLSLFWQGEYLDSETGCPHLASVVFHAFALMEFYAQGSGTDDRPQERW